MAQVVEATRGLYYGPITALHHCSFECVDCLFVAFGSRIRVFNTKNHSEFDHLQLSAPPSTVIHGFTSLCNHILMFGERFLSYIHLTTSSTSTNMEAKIVSSTNSLPDAVLASKLIQSSSSPSSLIVGFTHDFILRYSLSSSIATVIPDSKVSPKSEFGGSVLSSMTIINSQDNRNENVLVASGTMFGNVILWDSQTGIVLKHFLHANDGPINCISFSTTVDGTSDMMATCSDDKTVRCWSVSDGKCLGTHFGNLGRVWKCSLLNNYIIACGQDGVIRVWDRISGALLGCLHMHRETHIWSLCTWISNEKPFIATGGSDGSVKLFQVEDFLSAVSGGITSELPLIKQNPDENFPVLQRLCVPLKKLFVASNQGQLYSFDIMSLNRSLLCDSLGFIPSCMHCSYRILAIGGSDGEISIIFHHLQTDSTCIKIENTNTHEGKLVEIQVCELQDLSFVFASNWQGKIFVFEIHLNYPQSMKFLGSCSIVRDAPNSHQVVTSFAVVIPDYLFVAGDECGNLYLFKFPNQQNSPIFISKNAHGYSRVTSIAVVHKPCSKPNIFSTGRDGAYCRWLLNEQSFVLIERHTCFQMMKSIEGLVFPDSQGQVSIWGLYNDNIVLQSMDDSSVVLEISTVAKRNNFDLTFYNSDSLLWIALIKKRRVFLSRPTHSEGILRHCTIIPSMQAHEINCVKFTAPWTFITGSRDTTLQMWRFYQQFAQQQEICGHTSTIKCFSVCKDYLNRDLLLSGGGNSELLCFVLNNANGQSTYSKLGKTFNFDMTTYSNNKNAKEYNDKDYDESDCRVTCIVPLPGVKNVVCCTSDAFCYLLTFSDDKFIIAKRIELESTPLCGILIGTFASKPLIAIGMANGNIKILNGNDISTLCSVQAHDIGTNAISILSNSGNVVYLSSGGDDQSVSISKVEINDETVSLSSIIRLPLADLSAITSVVALKSCSDDSNLIFFTCGISQRLRRWKFDPTKPNLTEAAEPIMVDVADVASMDILPSQGFDIAIVGQGMQLIHFNR